VERLQPFGLTSVPAPGDEVLLISTNGDREHAIAAQVGSSANRVSGLDEGEVAVYRDVNNKIVFRANGDVEITTEGQLSVNGGNLTVESA
jgi:phage gp45-like